jgi:cyanophycinase
VKKSKSRLGTNTLGMLDSTYLNAIRFSLPPLLSPAPGEARPVGHRRPNRLFPPKCEVAVNCESFSTAHCALRHYPGCAITRRLVFLVISVLLAAPIAVWTAAPPLTAEVRKPNGTTAKAPAGWLVIVGGGSMPDAVRNRFLELAGGKNAHLVIIPTAHTKADHLETMASYPYWKAQKVASVAFLHTRNHDEANDPKFVKPLTEATGVWFPGGDQSMLVAPYRDSLVERELHRLLARGGVIGGTSAGASAMSRLMVVGGNPLAQVGTGFGLLPEVVIDQHFHNRNRLPRLLSILTRYPQYLGLGIDEETAVVMHGGQATILGNANVRLCLPGAGKDPAQVRVLKAGEKVDLGALLRRQTLSAVPRPTAVPVTPMHPDRTATPLTK